MFNERIQNNLHWIIVALGFFSIINSFVVYIIVKPFPKGPEGFTASGHPIFYMVPFAFSTYVCFAIVLLSALVYLWKKNIQFDLLLVSSTQTGVVVGIITIVVGMIWAKPEWGDFWTWTPRETATLIMVLAYIGLLIFREMLEEKNYERKATLSAVFGIAAAPSVPLSNFVVGVLHPAPQQTTLGEGIVLYLMINFLFVGLLTLILVYMAFRVNSIDFEIKKIRINKMEEV